MRSFSWVRDEIIRLAEEYPDEHPPDVYFHADGKPCCIVGHVLHALGVTAHGQYLAANGKALMRNNFPVSNVDWGALGVEKPTLKEKRWIESVQAGQDCGMSWGRALREA